MSWPRALVRLSSAGRIGVTRKLSVDATPIELFTAAIGTITAAGVLYLAYDLRALNRKFDRLEGRVNAVEAAQNAHVNAPGLHGIR